jgi:hypothetical protein
VILSWIYLGIKHPNHAGAPEWDPEIESKSSKIIIIAYLFEERINSIKLAPGRQL